MQAIASVEVATWGPNAALMRDFSWPAFQRALMLLPVTAHIFLAWSFPVVADTLSYDCAATTIEDEPEEVQEDLEGELEIGDRSGRDNTSWPSSGTPDYAGRLARRQAAARARQWRYGCAKGPHECVLRAAGVECVFAHLVAWQHSSLPSL